MPSFLILLAISIVLSALSYLLRPKIPKPEARELETPDSKQGKTIPAVFGRQVVSMNVVATYDNQRFIDNNDISFYFLNMIGIICHGSVDELTDILFEDIPVSTAVVSDFFGGFPPSPSVPFDPLIPITQALNTGVVKAYIAASQMQGGTDAQGGVVGPMQFYWGDGLNAVDPFVASKMTGFVTTSASAPKWKELCYVVFGTTPAELTLHHPEGSVFNFYWAANTGRLPEVAFLIKRYPHSIQDTMPGCSDLIDISGDANPIECIYDIMTNTIWGMGVAGTQFNIVRWQEAAGTCRDEDLGISFTLFEQNSAEDTVEEILRHIDAEIYNDPQTGLLEIKLIRGDYVVADIAIVTEQNSRDMSFEPSSWSEIITEIVVNYKEFVDTGVPAAGQWIGFSEGGSARAQNIAAASAIGEIRSKDVDYPMYTRAVLAQRKADQLIQALSRPLARATWKMSRRGFALAPGSVVNIIWPNYGIANAIMRVISVDYGNMLDGTMSFQAVLDVFGTGDSIITAPPVGGAPGGGGAPLIPAGWGLSYGQLYGGQITTTGYGHNYGQDYGRS